MQTFTITFGDVAENHKGMQKIGVMGNGYTHDDLISIKTKLEERQITCELMDLDHGISAEARDVTTGALSSAHVLIIRNGVNSLIHPYTSDELFNEHNNLEKDTKAFMYGRVVNKKARHNLCFSDFSQEPDYENGKGRIVSWPMITNILRNSLSELIGEKGQNLVAEGNYYYDITKCGIGYHGDSERKRVIGVRLGATMLLTFWWYKNNKRVGSRINLNLNHGDIYIMSEKATGNDWKKRSIYTLRHAAGCEKFIE